MSMVRILTCLISVFLFATACSPGTSTVDSSVSSTETTLDIKDSSESQENSSNLSESVFDYASSTADNSRPVISVTESKSTPSKLLFSDIKSGDGPQVEAGDLIEVQYVGALLDSGLEFDTSWDRGQSFFVLIGVGAVIQGWDQGIVGMQAGSRRLLIIPPELAYGEQGAGEDIGPDSSLAFVVDLLQIVNISPPEITVVDPLDNDSLLMVDETVGTSDRAVEPGDTITVHYLGTLEDGTIFDASWRRGQPFTTQIGVGRVIPGWDQGMIGMKEGGRRLLHIPSDLAYGKNGSGSTIGPDTPLVFIVDLLRIHN